MSGGVYLRLAILFVMALGATVASGETLRVLQGPHPLDEYAIGALKVAVSQLDAEYQVEVKHDEVTQTRVMEQVKLDRLDVMWLASNQKVEDELLPIRFPLLKGLLGYRVSIINPNNQHRFMGIDSMADLKQLSFGQGYGWPDVGILESNGLNVMTTSKYQNLFYMVEGGRFDAFPRGVLEPWVELKNFEQLGLTVDSEIVMVYPLPFYLFVSPDRPELAAQIARGFELALRNGAFDRYFYSQEMTKVALERANLKDREVFRLSNPSLPPKTPLEREELWYQLEGL